MATVFDRISLICRSKANALISTFENPAEIVEQTIIDAKKEYATAKSMAADVFANMEMAKRKLEEYEAEERKWMSIAEKAVIAGNDEDAQKALNNSAEFKAKKDKQAEVVKKAVSNFEALRKKLNNMAEQIKQMEDREAEIKADMANAEAARAVNSVSGDFGSSAFEAFDRMVEKASKERIAAEAASEFDESFTGDEDDLEEKYGSVESPSLMELKARLGIKTE